MPAASVDARTISAAANAHTAFSTSGVTIASALQLTATRLQSIGTMKQSAIVRTPAVNAVVEPT